MTELLPYALLFVAVVTLFVVIFLMSRFGALGEAQRKLDESLRLELQTASTNAARSSEQIEQLRSTLQETARADRQEVREMLARGTQDSTSKLESVSEILGQMREALHDDARKNREELNNALLKSSDVSRVQVTEALETLREAVDVKLKDIQTTSTTSIERIRLTVEQKLSETLETKLAQKFETVQGYLAQVQQGIGEMKSVATEVSGLKNVLGNVSSRGNFGEVILKTLIADTLAPHQYVEKFSPVSTSGQNVEFAIKIPQKSLDNFVYLPVDSKFPTTSYEELTNALRSGDEKAQRAARKDLADAVKEGATDIFNKYIKPPVTTDMAILFLPSEGLYAEAMSIKGLSDDIYRKKRIIIAGPSTFAAILNNLRLVHRDVAISQQAAKISQSLAGARAGLEELAQGIGSLEKKLSEATSSLGRIQKKNSSIMRSLSHFETGEDSEELPALPAPRDEDTAE